MNKKPGFDLSKKILFGGLSKEYFYLESVDQAVIIRSDVKEFIKRREEVIWAFLREEINCAKMWIELNKLSGGLASNNEIKKEGNK